MQSTIKNIHREISNHTNALLTCLNSEFESLNTHDYKALIDIAVEKQSLVQHLNELDQQRELLSPVTSYIDYLKQLDTPALVDEWIQIQEKIKQCNLQNETNGRLITKLNLVTQETLGLFTGHQSNTDLTYSPGGLKNGTPPSITNTRV